MNFLQFLAAACILAFLPHLAKCAANASSGTTVANASSSIPTNASSGTDNNNDNNNRSKNNSKNITTLDCPDTDVLCRIASSDRSSLRKSDQCTGGASGNEAGIVVSGSCTTKTSSWRGTSWFDIGAVQAGQCYDFLAGGCQVNNCKRTLSTHCRHAFHICKFGRGSKCQGCQPGNPAYFPC
ncbi:unnamed protein product [Polarella glacialis]|uniref:Secreted protein n=2 Tax=Polarella glacialis TaxID=89957 RepID=A0A813F6M0_POLGL|nr:unnamed protein product [Polarella glacialis]